MMKGNHLVMLSHSGVSILLSSPLERGLGVCKKHQPNCITWHTLAQKTKTSYKKYPTLFELFFMGQLPHTFVRYLLTYDKNKKIVIHRM